MARFALLLPLALLLSGVLFLGIAQLATGERDKAEVASRVSINIAPLRFDVAVQDIEFTPPPPPPDPVTPPKAPTPSLIEPSVQPPAVIASAPTINIKIQTSQVALPKLQTAAPTAPAAPSVPMDVPKTLATNSAPTAPLTVDPVLRLNPQYPRRALRRRLEGFVEVEFTVSKNGKVAEDSFTIVQSEPEGVFDKAVKKALLKWRFAPRQEGGQLLAYRARQRLEFKLQ